MKKLFKILSFYLFPLASSILLLASSPATTLAIYDPLSVPNNKLGIHMISPTPQETEPAKDLVNTQGDWGYVTVVIEEKDKDVAKWQTFFNDLRKKHLIPLVRIATLPKGDFWERPDPGDAQSWADFLDKLIWPIKNRYVTIYNEPNHAKEWGNTVDAKDYAQTLDQTIKALKDKSPDFFVLNAGLDASAPQKLPAYQDELNYLKEMKQAVPDLFDKLDGWVSHSYPNPNFAGSPSATGRGTVRTYQWELQTLQDMGVTKTLPVFITETGWKHAEGLAYDKSLPTQDVVSGYLKEAFKTAWSSGRIVAVTPFLLNYQQAPFDHFSFKKLDGTPQLQVLGAESPNTAYYSIFDTMKNLDKVSGRPVQENKAELIKGEIYSSLVAGQNYTVALTFKNTGQSIWSEYEPIRLVPTGDTGALDLSQVYLPQDKKVEPGGNSTFYLRVTSPESGQFHISLNLYEGNKKFDNEPWKFSTEVKSPVILKIKSALKWKQNPSGEYFLTVVGAAGNSTQKINLDTLGTSNNLEAKFLLPEYNFDFSLEKPFYQPKIIHQQVHSGVNELDFGELQPDISSALLDPKALWQLMPWSN